MLISTPPIRAPDPDVNLNLRFGDGWLALRINIAEILQEAKSYDRYIATFHIQ